MLESEKRPTISRRKRQFMNEVLQEDGIFQLATSSDQFINVT